MSINSAAGTAVSSNASLALLVARVLLSFMFILAGFGKLTAIAGTAGWFGSLGLPMPTATAVIVGLLELVGGLAVLIGFKTRIAAIVLGLFTLGATAIAHMDFADGMQVLLLQKNLTIVGGLLALAIVGAGALSLDARRG